MKNPSFSPPAVVPRSDASRVEQVRAYELITPLFGGGVEPASADPITVVRVPEIRGHLRFWWRACKGGQFSGDLKAMKEDEAKIWGAAETPSKVQVTIAVKDRGTDAIPFSVIPDPRGGPRPKLQDALVVPAYAALPLLPDESARRHIGWQSKPVRRGVKFELCLSYPKDLSEDVQAALWAWETFGGLGARTRRGFGSLCCVSVDGAAVSLPSADPRAIERTVREGLSLHVVPGRWPDSVPRLDAVRFETTNAKRNTGEAWWDLIDKLRGFRQNRDRGAGDHAGRTHWPEADAIRLITRQQSEGHAPDPGNPQKFPRAALGLPIIFHFKDMNRRNPTDPDSDPADTTLQGPGDLDRLASPLILRPMACADGKAVGLALVLRGCESPPGGLVLLQNKRPRWSSPSAANQLTPSEAAFGPLNGQTDVLEAFLKTV